MARPQEEERPAEAEAERPPGGAATCQGPLPAKVLEGFRLFNARAFFEQHEALEEAWLAEPGPVRDLYRGILQIGVSLYHIQRKNHHGAVYMLTRGTSYLRPFSPICQSVDVEDLLTQASRVLSAVQQLGKDRLGQFDWSLSPRVHLVDSPPVGQ